MYFCHFTNIHHSCIKSLFSHFFLKKCLKTVSSLLCSHWRPLPVDRSLWQHGKGLESPGLDAAEDARRTRGEGTNSVFWLVRSASLLLPIGGDNVSFVFPGDGRRRVSWWKTDRHQLIRPNFQTLALRVRSQPNILCSFSFFYWTVKFYIVDFLSVFCGENSKNLT